MKNFFFSVFLLLGYLLSCGSANAGVYMGTAVAVPAPLPTAGCTPGMPCYESVVPFIAGYHGKMHRDLPAAIVPAPVVLTIDKPSLKENMKELIKDGPWERLIWKLPYDLKWVGVATITAESVQDAIAKILEPYALQAVFYRANHVVVIKPRNMHNV